jgi:GNAT superfamily N-acetyltransferase
VKLSRKAHGIAVRPYETEDEAGWLRCRLLSFFGSAFFDDVVRQKERYERPAIDSSPTTTSRSWGFSTWNATRRGLPIGPGGAGSHPDHQRRGIASALLEEAERRAREHRLVRLEAWTRDDAHVQRWYETHGFTKIDSYLHVYLEREDLRALDGELRLVKAFAHYTGDRPGDIRQRYGRVHDDVLYEKQLR